MGQKTHSWQNPALNLKDEDQGNSGTTQPNFKTALRPTLPFSMIRVNSSKLPYRSGDPLFEQAISPRPDSQRISSTPLLCLWEAPRRLLRNPLKLGCCCTSYFLSESSRSQAPGSGLQAAILWKRSSNLQSIHPICSHLHRRQLLTWRLRGSSIRALWPWIA